MQEDKRSTLCRKGPALKIRSEALAAIRDFFRQRDFLEVETPIRVRAPALEEHIDAEPSGDFFLRTSPELHMKRLLAAGHERIYQLGACFRQGESGPFHSPEYTMLEWYRAPADYRDILSDTQELIQHVVATVCGGTVMEWQGHRVRVDGDWRVIPVRDAFGEWANWDPVANFDADRFDVDLIERVEPALRDQPVPCVLIDYPRETASLARRKPTAPDVAERWELYLAGLEIANAFSELIDADEQEARFMECARNRRAAGRTVYPMDHLFLDALRRGMPPSGGIALGVDRLVMLLANAATIEEVRPFR